jgi:hypothetical protein
MTIFTAIPDSMHHPMKRILLHHPPQIKRDKYLHQPRLSNNMEWIFSNSVNPSFAEAGLLYDYSYCYFGLYTPPYAMHTSPSSSAYHPRQISSLAHAFQEYEVDFLQYCQSVVCRSGQDR